ncbi:hypothetical protein BDW_05600 [Bdellovibrio bacteriovorus W]|nr:hypothetical protein BDW_05600 [Bdellovibrio bacteriovorus W]
MDLMMTKVLSLCTSVILIVGASSALASERVSTSEWAKNWSTQKNKTFSTQSLEAKALSLDLDKKNKSSLDLARKQFAQGQFDQALSNYDKIPRGDDQWLLAVEEKGWAHFRKEDYSKALSQSKTLLAPQFSDIVSPEAYLLQSLSQLRICDYQGVFETHQTFKEKQRNRMIKVQSLSETGFSDAVATVLKKADSFPLTLADLGDSARELPLLIHRDKEFQTQALRIKAAEKALAALPAGSTKLERQIRQSQNRAMTALKKRIKEIALAENEANFKAIQKLNLVEVEAIQRVHTDLGLEADQFEKTKFQKVGSDKLVFMDDGRPWIDELDKYEVATKACVKNIRRKM